MKWFNVGGSSLVLSLIANCSVFLCSYIQSSPADYDIICKTAAKPFNTTCSWRGFDERIDQTRTQDDWFRGCACYMIGV
jgi:hypothetical protein